MLGDSNSQQLVRKLLQQSIRLDGRQVFQRRQISLQFMDKPGCLLYSQGQTQIMLKTSTEIVQPKPQRPSQGFISFRVNCMSCGYSYEQNKKNANQLTKLLEKVIVGSSSLDPQSLCILTGKFVWQIVVDCVVVRDAGNFVDAILNGAIAALMDMRKPLATVDKSKVILDKKLLPLSIAHTPLSFTFGMSGNCIFIDPSREQQLCSETRMTISMNVYSEICSIHKPGGKGVSENVLSGVIRVGEKQIKQLTNQIRKLVKDRVSIVVNF